MHDTWDTVGRLVAWLDEKSAAPADTAPLLRVLKIVEEAGEVAEAVHGAYGSNPARATATHGTTYRPNCATSSSRAWSP